MPTTTISISVNEDDVAYLRAHPEVKPSQLFRQAMFMHRAGRLELERIDAGTLIDEIYKLRTIIAAQNANAREADRELKKLRAEVKTDGQA